MEKTKNVPSYLRQTEGYDVSGTTRAEAEEALATVGVAPSETGLVEKKLPRMTFAEPVSDAR